MEPQRTPNKVILRKKNKNGGIMLPKMETLKQYGIGIKTNT